MTRKLTRRGVLAGSAAIATASFAVQVRAAPEVQKITPALIEAAKKEGKLSWYTSVDLPVAEKIAKAFEAAYPGVSMKVEHSGAERIFQRIGQEAQSKIYNCDVVNSSDAAHLIIWKRGGRLRVSRETKASPWTRASGRSAGARSSSTLAIAVSTVRPAPHPASR